MSINSTLTTIAAAGAGGGLSYWVNEILCTQSGGVIGSVFDASPDHVGIHARTNGSVSGAYITLNQDGALQAKNHLVIDGNSSCHANGLMYDASTDAWYTTIYDGARQLIGRFSGSPGGSFTWLKDLGHGGADTEHTAVQAAGSDIIFGVRISGRAGVCKVAKSNGNKIAYKSYEPQNLSITSATIVKGNEYTNNVTVIGTRFVSGVGLATVIGNLTKSLGNISSGKYMYQSWAYGSNAGKSEAVLDGSGNTYGQWHTYFWSTDSSGNLRFVVDQQYGKYVAFAWAQTGGYLLALTQSSDLVRINPANGLPLDGFRRGITGGDMKPISSPVNSELRIDEANNVAWFTKEGVNGELFIVKRPLDSSLDGTYGSFTLATNTIAQSTRNDVYLTNQPFYQQSESASQTTKTASLATDYRFYPALTKI